VAPFDIERKLRAKYTLLGVHNIVLFAMEVSTWRRGMRLARRLASRSRACWRHAAADPGYNSKGLGIMPSSRC